MGIRSEEFRYQLNEDTINNSSNNDIRTQSNDGINRHKYYKPCTVNVALTNARSLTPKIDSMVEAFEEMDLSLMLVSESWLKKGKALDKCLTDLEHADCLSLIHI